MSGREVFGWAAAFAVAVALLLLYDAPLWAVGFVAAVSVLFVVAAVQPAGRLKMTRQEVLDEGLGGSESWVWLRLVIPLVGIGIAAAKGDGPFVVFGVLVGATLVLAMLVFQALGIEFFGGTPKD